MIKFFLNISFISFLLIFNANAVDFNLPAKDQESMIAEGGLLSSFKEKWKNLMTKQKTERQIGRAHV